MPRVAWSFLLVLLFALPLTSCFDQETGCPTCPADNSARITVRLLPLGEVDSLHVSLESGDSVTVKRGGSLTYAKLPPGSYKVTVSRWFTREFVLFARTQSVTVKVQAGELRVITYHNDFPIVTDATIGRRAPLRLAGRPPRLRVG